MIKIKTATGWDIVAGGQNVQYSTMPTASSSFENKIVQYTGTTDTDYTSGYFYKCVNNSGTYSWTTISTQPGIKTIASSTPEPAESGWYYVVDEGVVKAFIK